jgi:hypothetical protein
MRPGRGIFYGTKGTTSFESVWGWCLGLHCGVRRLELVRVLYVIPSDFMEYHAQRLCTHRKCWVLLI